MTLLRFIFKITRVVLRTRLGQIPIGNVPLIDWLRQTLYPVFWKIVAPDPATPVRVKNHKIWGVSSQRGIGPGIGLLMDSYEETSSEIFQTFLQPGMVAVDVGAHIGYYTLLAARRVGPTGKVYAFEPEPNNYAWLQKNVGMNGYRNVVTVPKAIADRTGPIRLYFGNTTGTHSICPRIEDKKESTLIEAITLDEFLEAEGWPYIEVIKMDIEGAEALAFASMHRLMKRQDTLKVIFEFNPFRLEANGINPLKFLYRLQGIGFTIHAISEVVARPKVLNSDNIKSFVDGLRVDGVNLLCCKRTSKTQINDSLPALQGTQAASNTNLSYTPEQTWRSRYED